MALGLAITATAYVIFRSAYVQTRLTQFIASVLSDQLGTKVEVGGVDFNFPNYLVIEQLYAEDLHRDTLASLTKLSLSLKGYSISEKKVRLGSVAINDVRFFLRKYEHEDELNLQFIIDKFKSSDTTKSKAPVFMFQELELKNAAFIYADDNRAKVDNAIDYTHLEVRRINLHIKDISIEGDTVRGDVRRLAFEEKHGFTVKNLSGKAKVASNMLDVQNLVIQTECSYLSMNLLFVYDCWSDYKEFVDKVVMNFDLRPSVIDIGDLSFFARGLHGVTSTFRVEGKVRGSVGHMKGRGLRIGYGEATFFEGDIDMDGLPDINETFIHLKLKQLLTNKRDLATLPMPPFNKHQTLPIPDNVGLLGRMSFTGSFTGFINDFVAYGKLRTALGDLSSDVTLKQADNGRVRYSGSVAATAFDFGKFFDVKHLGKATLAAKVDGAGLTRKEIDARLSGKVQSVWLNNYDYQGIEVDGHFADNKFDGNATVRDANVNLDFNGKVDFTGQLPVFQFIAKVGEIDLDAINLYHKHANATVWGRINADFVGDDIDNLVGNLTLSEAGYLDCGEKQFPIKDLALNVTEDKGERTIKLRSSMADADFKGRFSFKHLPKAVNSLIRKHLPSYAGDFDLLKENESQSVNFSIKTEDLALVSHLFAPTLYIKPGGTLLGSLFSDNDEIQLSGSFPQITVGKQRFNDIEVTAGNPGRLFKTDITARSIFLTDSGAIRNVSLTSFTDNDSMTVALFWDNLQVPSYRAKISAMASFPRNQQVRIKFLPSEIVISDMLWTIDPKNLVTADSSTFSITDLRFLNEARSIGLNGQISKDPDRELEVKFNDFDVALLNLVTGRYGLEFGGGINGAAQISSVYATPLFRSQLMLSNFTLNKQLLGAGHINTAWLAKDNRLSINAGLMNGTVKTLDARGYFAPGENAENFDLDVKLASIPVSAASHYVEKVMSDLKGTLSAHLTLKGKTKAPLLDGWVDLNDCQLLFNYLNVRLGVNNRVDVRHDGFYFSHVQVNDERGKKGSVDGWVKHDNFHNFRFDASVRMENFLALNTNSAHNSLYYGKAFATGQVRFSGNPSDMNVTVAARTDRGTKFNLPLNGSRNIDEQEFVTFVKFKDGKAEINGKTDPYKLKISNLSLNLNVEVTSDAEVQILFDPKVGDILKGQGDGDLRIELTKQGEFKMFGDYVIREGEYLFTLQNIINKKFLIRQGGTINWTGSPYDAVVDLKAAYQVRTSLFNLMNDSTNAAYRKRILVNVLLNMTDKLMSPNIQFGIELPNVDDGLRTEVQNKIGVNNDQELNRQVFGLLVVNNFFLPEQDLASGGTGFLSSSSTEMLSNQLSNWLSKISNDFDVGVNYRPGNNISSDELEVALSTQLFNNRLLVDGNVGVANRQTNTSNIVGDVNIEYKITRDGKLRVRAFNKTNDQSLLLNNAQFTQGLGISYRKDFDRTADLFKKKPKPVAILRDDQPPALPQNEKTEDGGN